MQAVILTVHALIVIGLIILVLMQRSEGGALGMGGGGFMSSRGTANVLTRTTSVLAALFFSTSIALAVLAKNKERDADIIEDLTGQTVIDPTKPLSTDDLLNTLGSGATDAPTPAPSTTPSTATPPPILEAAPVEPAPAPEADASQPDAAAEPQPETTEQPQP